jgi:hypothetical protein
MSKYEVKAVVVTTAHRGVFFGYAVPSDKGTITLTGARMCVYWTSDLHGVCGLATQGPRKGCKIGPKVERMTLREVTSVMECSEQAAKNWSEELWTS